MNKESDKNYFTNSQLNTCTPVKIKKINVKMLIFVYPSVFTCFGCSKVLSHLDDDSFEYSQHVFQLRNKIYFSIHILNLSPAYIHKIISPVLQYFIQINIFF